MPNTEILIGWVSATFIAAITFVTYINSYLFTKTEGTKLETRVDKLEEKIEAGFLRVEDKLDKMQR